MKLPSSKIYWADFLSYSALLSDREICQVLKLIAKLSMSYENPQDNLQVNLQDSKLKLIHKQIQSLNKIQSDFFMCLKKAQDESAKSYLASINNGKLGGRPKSKPEVVDVSKLGSKIGSKVVGKYLLDDKFNIFDVPDVDIYVDEVGRQTVIDVQTWLKDKKAGQLVDGKFICRQIYNFAKRNGLVRG